MTDFLKIILFTTYILYFPCVSFGQMRLLDFNIQDLSKEHITEVKIKCNSINNTIDYEKIIYSYDSIKRIYNISIPNTIQNQELNSIIIHFNHPDFEKFEVPLLYVIKNSKPTVISLSDKGSTLLNSWPLSHSITDIQNYTKESIIIDSNKVLISLKKSAIRRIQVLKRVLSANDLIITEELNFNNENPCLIVSKKNGLSSPGITNKSLKNLRNKKRLIYNVGAVFYFKNNTRYMFSFSNNLEVYVHKKDIESLKTIIKQDDLKIKEIVKVTTNDVFRINLYAKNLISYNINTISNKLIVSETVIFCTPLIIDSTPIWDGKAQ